MKKLIIILLFFLCACGGDNGKAVAPSKADGGWFLTPESRVVYIPLSVDREGLYFEDRTVSDSVVETVKTLLDERIDNWIANNPNYRSRVQRVNYVLYNHWYFPAYGWPWNAGAFDCYNTVYLAIYNKWEGYDYPVGINLAPSTIQNIEDSTEHILKWYGGWIPNGGFMVPALEHELDHVIGKGTDGDKC
jgi:hypothetical protein